jgi:hypothetical protein
VTNLSNRPTLASIRSTPIADVAKLLAEHLALLQEEAAEALDAAKQIKEQVDGAIALRFAGLADAERRVLGKDTGTVRFNRDGILIVADLPKKVDWDQTLLAAVVERIRAAGDDPSEYVDIAIKVPERKYGAWPDNIRAAFAPARTVKTGKQTFRLTIGGEASS